MLRRRFAITQSKRKRTMKRFTPPSDLERVETAAGQALVSVPLIRLSGRSVRTHMTLDEGVAAFIDGEARRRGMTRTAYVEWMARRVAEMGG